jgi:hypothetical protein
VAVTENVAVWPTRMELLFGCAVIEGATAIPVPLIWTTKGKLSCDELKEAAPDIPPVELGAKVAVNVALLPGFKLRGSATPLMLKPAPEALAWEIVTELVPELLSVKL